MPSIRCLLISPLPPGDPENGDAQYTRDLLANPPAGVTYVAYQDAIAAGELAEAPSWRGDGRRPRDAAGAITSTSRLALHGLRQAGALLHDPVRWWEVRGDFDVVHVQCMPTHLSGRRRPPVVLTDSAGTFWYWTRARGMDEDKTWRMLRRERLAAKALSYCHPSARPDGAAAALYFVESGVRFATRVGAAPDRLGVCPVGVPAATSPRHLGQGPPTLAFVAHNFGIKGGPAALEIHRRVRAAVPGTRLLVAGPEDPDPRLDGVEWLGPMGRQQLYDEVYPQADIFVYPTTFDTAALVVMEAMANGVPVVAPAALALPDVLTHGKSGFLFPEGAIDEATEATLRLAQDTGLRSRMGEAARDEWARRHAPEVRNRLLRKAYDEAMSSSSR